jgi:histidine ammonia-lyase
LPFYYLCEAYEKLATEIQDQDQQDLIVLAGYSSCQTPFLLISLKLLTMTYIIKGSGLTIEDVVNVARHNEKVELHPDALARIIKCRAMLEKKIDAHEIMYGVNTGIGEFSEVVLDDDQVKEFQRYLIYNHAAGIGEAMPVEWVRGAMLGRANVHAHGNSGVRPEITQTLIDMLNKGVTPFVCEKGSVGACGDLAPMSQIALLMMGEGKAYYEGELLEGKEALDRAGIPIPGLQARDGLATINGSNVLTAMSAIFLYDANRWLKQAEIAASMSLEALKANMRPYTSKLHEVRGFSGAIRSANAINRMVQGGDLKEGRIQCKVQDAYSMRSTPQVIGTAHDAIAYAKSQVEIELNGVGDNPIFFPDEDLQISGANFQGSPVAMPMDMAGAAITMVSILSERRMNRLNNPALSVGLPAFLTKGAGMFSGLMLSQYTADMQIVEQRILSAPASIQSIPAAADQEDFVSMGMNVALKNFQIFDNACGILGIELMAAAQALDFREYNFGNGVQKAHEVVRRHVDFLDIDRPLYPDHNKMKDLVYSCEILEEVEKEVGSLE